MSVNVYELTLPLCHIITVGGLSTIAIVLIVVGILAILLAILGCCMCCCILGRRRYEEGEKYANWRQRASNDSPMFNNRSDMEMEDRRIGRLAQVLARSPYMQQVGLLSSVEITKCMMNNHTMRVPYK